MTTAIDSDNSYYCVCVCFFGFGNPKNYLCLGCITTISLFSAVVESQLTKQAPIQTENTSESFERRQHHIVDNKLWRTTRPDKDTHAALAVRFSFTFARGKSFVPHRLAIIPHHAGYGFGSHRDVAMVAVVGDLRPQFVVVAQPTGIHDVAGVETGLAWFFCATGKESVWHSRETFSLFNESHLNSINNILIIDIY